MLIIMFYNISILDIVFDEHALHIRISLFIRRKSDGVLVKRRPGNE